MGTTKNAKDTKRFMIVRSVEQMISPMNSKVLLLFFCETGRNHPCVSLKDRINRLTVMMIIVFESLVCFVVNRLAFRSL